MDFPTWLAAWLSLGLLVAVWNTYSAFYKDVAHLLRSAGRGWVLYVAFLLAILAGPTGAIIYAIVWLKRRL